MFKFCITALLAVFAASRDSDEFSSDDYLAQSRQEKSDQIWAKVIENTESGGWHFAQAPFIPQDPVFDSVGDQLECSFVRCRPKTIHSQGNVAKIQWKSLGGHNFTGMFKGADAGFARLGVARPTDTETPNMAPGMAVKLLRDGYDSANFVCTYSVDGQDSLDFFAHDFVNHAPDIKQLKNKPVEVVGSRATNYVQAVGLSEMAQYTQDGQAEAEVVFPWALRFVPGGTTSFPATVADGYTDFRTQLATIPSGTLLYTVFAMDAPEELGGTETKIAEIVTQSELTTSNWGDEKMYFRHVRMEDDFALKPEWEPFEPKYDGIFNLEQQCLQQTTESACPFAQLLQYLQ